MEYFNSVWLALLAIDDCIASTSSTVGSWEDAGSQLLTKRKDGWGPIGPGKSVERTFLSRLAEFVPVRQLLLNPNFPLRRSCGSLKTSRKSLGEYNLQGSNYISTSLHILGAALGFMSSNQAYLWSATCATVLRCSFLEYLTFSYKDRKSPFFATSSQHILAPDTMQ
jgi:hypothetical protein